MRRRCFAIPLALLLFGVSACTSGTPDPEAGVHRGTGATRSSEAPGWVEISEAPLSPRTGALAAWIGGEVLVVGGSQNLCPPGADCAMTQPALLDGAAYSPNDDSWRPISPSPRPVLGTPLVGDDAVFFETSMAVPTSSAEEIARYRPSTDAWDVITVEGHSGAWLESLFMGRLVLNDPGAAGLVLVDPVDGSTEQLVAPPTPPLHSTQVAVVGDLLYLFGNERLAGDTSRPSLRMAVVYDERDGWRRLPDSEALGGFQPLAVGPLLVDSADGSADGGQVDNWGRSYPYGASFDAATEAWKSLPADRPSGAWSLPHPVRGDTGIVTTDALWLDPIRGAWTPIPIPATPTTDAAIAWAGDRLFVWGGSSWVQRQDGRPGDGTLHNEGSTRRLP